LTGSGVGVAVIDSGIDVTPDLSVLGLLPRVVYTQDFTGGNGSDQYGDGTHVAGIIGGNGSSSQCLGCTRSLVGIAPNVSLINLRVLNGNGQGSDSSVIQAIERAVALKQQYNIRVINLSLWAGQSTKAIGKTLSARPWNLPGSLASSSLLPPAMTAVTIPSAMMDTEQSSLQAMIHT
jgi:subtilisin family serine protease